MYAALVHPLVLSKLSLHPADEASFEKYPDIFRPSLAADVNARKLHMSRFACVDRESNMIISMGQVPINDQNGYVVSFTSFEEIPENSPVGPDECVLVAYNYHTEATSHKKRYKAIELKKDTIVDAIRIIRADDFDSNRKTHELLETFLDTLNEKLPKSANLHDNFKFINDYMRSLLDDESQPCWERERMKTLLQQEASVDIESVEIKKFTARWIANNIPLLFKIITHKTDGAHRDFAYDAIYTGTFGKNQDPTLEENFLKEPHPHASDELLVQIYYSIPSEFNQKFLWDQKEHSLHNQKKSGNEKSLDLIDVNNEILNIFYRTNPDIWNKYFITEGTVGLLMNSRPTKEDFLNCVRDFGVLNYDAIVDEVDVIFENESWVSVFPALLEHFFIFDRALRLQKLLTSDGMIPPYLLEVLKNSGIDLKDYFPPIPEDSDMDQLNEVLQYILLPKSIPQGANIDRLQTKSFLKFTSQSSYSKQGANNSLVKLFSNNKDVFLDPYKANVKAFFTKPDNKTNFNDISGSQQRSRKVPASLMASIWILLFSFLSTEVSDEVGNFLRKATKYNSADFSRQMSAGDEKKALNYLVVTFGKILDDYGLVADAFQKVFDSTKGLGLGFNLSPRPKFDRFLSILMSTSVLGSLEKCRKFGMHPVIDHHDRKYLGEILDMLFQKSCCTEPLQCKCPEKIGGSVLGLRILVEALINLNRRKSDKSGELLSIPAEGDLPKHKLVSLLKHPECASNFRLIQAAPFSASTNTDSENLFYKPDLSVIKDSFTGLFTNSISGRKPSRGRVASSVSVQGNVDDGDASQGGAQVPDGDAAQVGAPGGVGAGPDGQGDQGDSESNKTSKSKKRSRKDENGEEGAPSKRSKSTKKKKTTDKSPDTVTSASNSGKPQELTCESVLAFCSVIHYFGLLRTRMDVQDKTGLKKYYDEKLLPHLERGVCTFKGCNLKAATRLFGKGIKEKEIAVSKPPICIEHKKMLKDSGNHYNKEVLEEHYQAKKKAAEDSSYIFICVQTGKEIDREKLASDLEESSSSESEPDESEESSKSDNEESEDEEEDDEKESNRRRGGHAGGKLEEDEESEDEDEDDDEKESNRRRGGHAGVKSLGNHPNVKRLRVQDVDDIQDTEEEEEEKDDGGDDKQGPQIDDDEPSSFGAGNNTFDADEGDHSNADVGDLSDRENDDNEALIGSIGSFSIDDDFLGNFSDDCSSDSGGRLLGNENDNARPSNYEKRTTDNPTANDHGRPSDDKFSANDSGITDTQTNISDDDRTLNCAYCIEHGQHTCCKCNQRICESQHSIPATSSKMMGVAIGDEEFICAECINRLA